MKLYVGNLPFSVTSEELRELFSQYGTVHSAEIVTDRDTGRPRGFGFVEMDGAAEAIDALNGHNLQGRNLKVAEAQAQDRRGGGGGGGGRRSW